ncbi:ISAs1 family transposase [Dankookia sp. GCM10030260]|uniref:ISAs1 family transposase n=1 Tax=Dankookia sp. GCM10030260 TaxID=3273390 RepID=UPI0036108DD2
MNRPDGTHATTDAESGRIEVRQHRVSHDIAWSLADRRHPNEARMPGLATIGEVEASRARDGQTSTTWRLYLSSARLDAVGFTHAFRAHGAAIENSLHWMLDVGFDEDRAKNRRDNGPENLAILRKLALNLLHTARPDISIRRKRKRSGWSDDFAKSVIGQMR